MFPCHLPRSSRVAISRLLFALLPLLVGPLAADDWPQWLGPRRDGIWRESGLRESFPPQGPPVRWRVPVHAGYVGPALARGRLFLVDRQAGKPPERARGDRTPPFIPGNERVLCLDAATGSVLWERAYDCPYNIAYPAGPRATPLVHGGQVFTLGAMGDLRCWKVQDGTLVWAHNLPKEYQTEPPVWGYASHPLLEGDHLICPVGGTNSALVAFHKDTGREIWRALTAQEIGYAPPALDRLHGRRQVVFWHPDAITGLDPRSGRVLWTQPYPVGGKPQRPEVTIAVPRLDANRVLLTSFYQGSLLLQVPRPGEQARVIWNRRSPKLSEISDGLHAVMATPVIEGGFLYGICAYGELRCLRLADGERQWQTLDLFGDRAGFLAHAFIIPQGRNHWFWTDQGDLILGRLTPQGFTLLSRAHLLDPIENTRGRDVLWCHPALANRHAYWHNGRELICVNLAEP